jgi:hypothetical protein
VGKVLKLILLFFLPLLSQAQQIKVDGYFLQDSAKLGERVGYVLKATYPASTELIFPDSTFDYSPLVLLEKQTFISSTIEGVTLDSAIYYLSNFSLDPSVFLTLPVYELARYDSVVNYPLEAELKLKLTLDSIPEELVFQQNNVYQSLERDFNWIIASIIIGGILVLLAVLYLLFAKRIQEYWNTRKEKKRWETFEKNWQQLTADLTANPSTQLADKVIGIWKAYMESISNLPIMELTSSEIAERLDDKKVYSSLKTIDLIIYAGRNSESQEATDYLLEVARSHYQDKQTNIKHERTAV